MSDDFLDAMMTNGEEAEQRDPRAGIAVCGCRAESSAALEEAERLYFADVLAHPLEHIPLLYADGKLEPLTREDKAILKSCGVTEEEFLALVEQTK